MCFGSTEYQVSLKTKQTLRSFLTIHKGCIFPGRFRHTSYPHQRIDADRSISAPTRLKYSKSIAIDYPIATLVIERKDVAEFLECYDEDIIRYRKREALDELD